MKEAQDFRIGGRRVPRPPTVEACPECGELLGGGYASCPTCFQAVEGIWLADWQALLDEEGISPGGPEEQLLAQLVLAEPERYAWTILDIAMSRLRCQTCGSELGENYHQCAECGWAFGSTLAAEHDATPNEHALHIGRWVLRFPQRNSPNVVTGWRNSMPRLLTGWLPTTQQAQNGMRLIRSGRLAELQEGLRRVDEEIGRAAFMGKQ